MRLTLPYPPSANRYWRVFQGMVRPSKDAAAYKNMARWRALAQQLKPLPGDVVVTVTVYRPQKSGDLDNRLKCLLDALRGVAYEDDNQVAEIHALRLDDKSNPRVEVTVEPQAQQ